jgi:predicted RNase H-like HicB family nuclease
MMKYPIAIEPGNAEQAFGVVVPDLPGCFSAGDTLELALDNAREAIDLWLETTIDDGGAIPEPRPIGEHYNAPQYAGWIWAVLDIDLNDPLFSPLHTSMTMLVAISYLRITALRDLFAVATRVPSENHH